jgi:hypothetical protein
MYSALMLQVPRFLLLLKVYLRVLARLPLIHLYVDLIAICALGIALHVGLGLFIDTGDDLHSKDRLSRINDDLQSMLAACSRENTARADTNLNQRLRDLNPVFLGNAQVFVTRYCRSPMDYSLVRSRATYRSNCAASTTLATCLTALSGKVAAMSYRLGSGFESAMAASMNKLDVDNARDDRDPSYQAWARHEWIVLATVAVLSRFVIGLWKPSQTWRQRDERYAEWLRKKLEQRSRLDFQRLVLRRHVGMNS